jgi:hypothetical protein
VTRLFTGLLSALLGPFPYLLAAWSENSSFHVWPFQVVSAIGAVVLGLGTYLTSGKRYPGRAVAIGTAMFGATLGAFWLLAMGALWLVWAR